MADDRRLHRFTLAQLTALGAHPAGEQHGSPGDAGASKGVGGIADARQHRLDAIAGRLVTVQRDDLDRIRKYGVHGHMADHPALAHAIDDLHWLLDLVNRQRDDLATVTAALNAAMVPRADRPKRTVPRVRPCAGCGVTMDFEHHAQWDSCADCMEIAGLVPCDVCDRPFIPWVTEPGAATDVCRACCDALAGRAAEVRGLLEGPGYPPPASATHAMVLAMEQGRELTPTEGLSLLSEMGGR